MKTAKNQTISIEKIVKPKVEISKLQGVFKNCKCNSYDFMRNKEYEKQLENRNC
jgi:hypothetical protein